MDNDFLKEIGHLGLTARLKRMSDSISYSIKELYDSQSVKIEPGWHLVFLLLKEKKRLNMTEISEAFHISQPATFKMITKMKKSGYVEIYEDEFDRRRKQVILSRKAFEELPQLEKIWQAGQNSIKDILRENFTFMKALERFENELRNKSFKDRAIEHLNKES